MSTYQPPFVITPLILNQVIEIGELMGNWAAMAGRASPLLRKENRIRTIQASLAIEHNSLTTEQVTALMEGNVFWLRLKIYRKSEMRFWPMKKCQSGKVKDSPIFYRHIKS